MRDADNTGVDDAIDDLRVMRRVMLGQGFVEGEDLLVVEDEGARHHETAWATRLPGALRFLFPR
jgi:pullulanase